MIPKIIHYCWFGGRPIPAKEQKCMKSWHRFLPDFEIVRWDESRFDINSTPFTKEAYAAGKYAFVADYVRLYALSTFGGVYMDTDIEIIKPIYDLLELEAFGGFETDDVIQTGIIGSTSNGTFVKNMFEYYKNRHFIQEDGCYDQTPNSAIFARLLIQEWGNLSLKNERISLPDIELYPSEYFCPIDQATWGITTTPNTYCIHYLSGSWLPVSAKITRKIKSIVGNIFGFETVRKIRNMIVSDK